MTVPTSKLECFMTILLNPSCLKPRACHKICNDHLLSPWFVIIITSLIGICMYYIVVKYSKNISSHIAKIFLQSGSIVAHRAINYKRNDIYCQLKIFSVYHEVYSLYALTAVTIPFLECLPIGYTPVRANRTLQVYVCTYGVPICFPDTCYSNQVLLPPILWLILLRGAALNFKIALGRWHAAAHIDNCLACI
jgi:hypothetical protein